MELSAESGSVITVFLHGGCFCFPESCLGMPMKNLVPELATRHESCGAPRQGEVAIAKKQCPVEGRGGTMDINEEPDQVEGIQTGYTDNRASGPGSGGGDVGGVGNAESTMGNRESENCDAEYGHGGNAASAEPVVQLPRSAVVMVSSDGGLQLSNNVITHGESETIFVAAYDTFVKPMLEERSWFITPQSSPSPSPHGQNRSVDRSGCVVVSKDTDVTTILALAQCMHQKNVLHVLGESVIAIDTLLHNLVQHGANVKTLATVYVLDGCDFTAGTFGVNHEHYLRASIRHMVVLDLITPATEPTLFEVLTVMAYLEKHCATKLVNAREREELRREWSSTIGNMNEVRKNMKTLFTSEHRVASEEWVLDVRRFVSDAAKSASELMPPKEHIHLQGCRVRHIICKYWSNAYCRSLSRNEVGGCDEASGFTTDVLVLLEQEDDVKKISKTMHKLVAKCGCKGQCNTRQCSCIKRGVNCIGCDCDAGKCQNKVNVDVHIDNAHQLSTADGEEDEDSIENLETVFVDNDFEEVDKASFDLDDLPPLDLGLDVDHLLYSLEY